ELGERLGDGREGFLDGVQHGIGLGGHGVSPSSGLSYGLTPSGVARGMGFVTQLMVRRNIFVAPRYHESVIDWELGDLPRPKASGSRPGTPQTSAGQPRAGRRPPFGLRPAPHCARARRYR